ncbi:Glutamate receptor 3.7 [Camellia lanceoleosa]|uniref:Glutamate receptor 3.7 n=1 Tax=Camellia lanceoleosa TaxID=1840588 RepID=A0ACC0H807_9ERIC|nr:Glutamate receptor 3.7 [Camellia lanceoleosa]
MKFTMMIPLTLFILIILGGSVYCERPSVVNVGAIFSFNSVIGRVAKAAMEAAASDINADPRILSGTELKLIREDTNCSVFMGSIEAFQVIEREVVPIIGPQSSSIAHMISLIANGLQVPLVSYAASDPTLSALQFPYFFRTTQSDSYQMAAMADLIDFYGWKELAKKMSKVSFKLTLPTQYDLSDITYLLNKSKLLGPRVYVVHINPDPGLRIFTVAQKLHMMTGNYVWLSTDWLSATLDTFSTENQSSLKILEGVVGLRQHIPQTVQKKAFLSRWRKMQKNGQIHSELNVYGFYAYDTVWAVAHAIDKFLNEHYNIPFSFTDKLHDEKGTETQLGKHKVFDGGKVLLKKLKDINFTGLTGQIQFTTDQNLVNSDYDVINIAQMAIHGVGYWSNFSGLSTLPPETLKEEQISHYHPDQKLDNVTWPGGTTEKPRGWVVASNERPLRIGVPNRASFVEFVTESHSSHKIQGYCIDVFNEAQKLVPYDIPFKFEPFGDVKEDTVSTLGRLVMVVWLFLLMVITSSYTASLTSILTVQQLSSSSITGVDSLIAGDWPIGYQLGSFAYSCMTEILYIPQSRLISLGSPEEYDKALRLGPSNGGVAAIVDELPYVELFLSQQTDFGIVGQSFTRSGWGFAFQRDSPLAFDMSTAILQLAETGRL